jgi:hypothetical protein
LGSYQFNPVNKFIQSKVTKLLAKNQEALLGLMALDLVVGGGHILHQALQVLQLVLQVQVVIVLHHLQVGHRICGNLKCRINLHLLTFMILSNFDVRNLK